MSKNRYETLDHLRGAGCLIVLLFHSLLIINRDFFFSGNPLIYWSPLRIAWSGHQAVILFFVLSGFALYMMYASLNLGRGDKYLYFIASRLIRLYPVYAFSILFSATVYLILEKYKIEPANNIIIKNFRPPIKDILLHLIMFNTFNPLQINPPIWSIIVEVRASAIFPLIFFIINRYPRLLLILFLLSSITIGFFLLKNKEAHYQLSSWILTAHYLSFFAMGAAIAKNRECFIEKIANFSRKGKLTFFLGSILLYIYSFDFLWEEWKRDFGDILLGIGSSGINLSLLTTKKFHSKNLLFFGKISFSLYLMHFPCLVFISSIFSNSIPSFFLNLLAITTSILISLITWRLIESPSLILSRLTRKTL